LVAEWVITKAERQALTEWHLMLLQQSKDATLWLFLPWAYSHIVVEYHLRQGDCRCEVANFLAILYTPTESTTVDARLKWQARRRGERHEAKDYRKRYKWDTRI
jgi:hypothetical protein